MVHNGGSLNFKGLLFDKNTNYLAQILQSLSYMVCSIILLEFNTFRLFIPILGTSTIMDQTARCYNVTTSETRLQMILSFSFKSTPYNGSKLNRTATSGLKGRVPQLFAQLQKAFCFGYFPSYFHQFVLTVDTR